MNEKYALDRIDEFIFCIQKSRSILTENMLKGEKEIKADMYPWILGEKCPLDVLVKVSDRGTITKMDYYNFMVILHRFMPEVLILAATGNCELKNTSADMSILLEWEESPGNHDSVYSCV